jgi:hypothetical protein
MDIVIKAPDGAPAGTHPAVFDAIEQRTSREGAPFWRWAFTVQTPDGTRAISGASSTNTGPKSKAYRWFTALLGRKPVANETLGSNLAGRACMVVIVEGDDGYTDLEDVLPAFGVVEQTAMNLPYRAAPRRTDEPPLPPEPGMSDDDLPFPAA